MTNCAHVPGSSCSSGSGASSANVFHADENVVDRRVVLDDHAWMHEMPRVESVVALGVVKSLGLPRRAERNRLLHDRRLWRHGERDQQESKGPHRPKVARALAVRRSPRCGSAGSRPTAGRPAEPAAVPAARRTAEAATAEAATVALDHRGDACLQIRRRADRPATARSARLRTACVDLRRLSRDHGVDEAALRLAARGVRDLRERLARASDWKSELWLTPRYDAAADSSPNGPPPPRKPRPSCAPAPGAPKPPGPP